MIFGQVLEVSLDVRPNVPNCLRKIVAEYGQILSHVMGRTGNLQILILNGMEAHVPHLARPDRDGSTPNANETSDREVEHWRKLSHFRIRRLLANDARR